MVLLIDRFRPERIWGCQSTFILKVLDDDYVTMFDMWRPDWANDNFPAATITNRSVQAVSWNGLRGAAAAPSDTIGSNRNGSFFERLNALTGIGGFDLPTEVMAEIAQRAGETGVFSWGDEEVDVKDYAIGIENNSHQSSTGHHMPVGLGAPNNWGLFDTSGNCWEFCRDDASLVYVRSQGAYLSLKKTRLFHRR